ncbi:gamma-aminobutyric acid type B receptor subunit 2-like isoform X3 [Stylophora pistillata]|uniref:gamma-aminobutyric acid type B receptor subunit 2-like isoform X3 n=1 Tax=Stylophora pistillata TaxID=50429 RepID=UPI000C04DFA9|nr:gamma-aminobutyric acid type B receptor subunit 2-like isoform X3 [Stylophora pistillata]
MEDGYCSITSIKAYHIMKTIKLSTWLLLSNLLLGKWGHSLENLYIGTFYGINVSSKGWSSKGVMPAVQMALEHVNGDQSILAGYSLHEDWRDSKCDSAAAIKAMLDLVSKPPTKVMFTAPGCSPAAEPIAEAAPFWGAVQVGFSNTSPKLSDDIRFPFYSRICSSETLNNFAIVNLLKHFKWKRVAILVQQDHIFTKTKENLVALLTKHNISIVFMESFEAEHRHPVSHIKRRDVRIIIGLMYEDQFRKIACQACHQGVTGRKYAWILPGWYSAKWWESETGDTSCSGDDILRAIGNYLATRPLPLGDSRTPTIAGKSAVELKDELLERSRKINYPTNGFSSFAYDAIWSIALTLHQSISVLQARNKSLANIKYGDREAAELFKRLLRNLTFTGMSGIVKFDRVGDRENTIEILQQQGKIPADGVTNTTEPYKAPRIQTIITIVTTSLGMLFSLGCLILNILYRKQRIIKMSSPHFNSITAFGCFLCYIHVFLAVFGNSFVYGKGSRSICVVRAYLIIVGFTLGFGGMLSKTWRVYKIFTNRRLKRQIGGLNTSHLMLKIFHGLLLDILVLVSWELVDPLQAKTIQMSEKMHPDDEDINIHITIHQCDSTHYSRWFLGILIYKGILLLFGVFLAWETRNVHYAELNDSKNIGVAVYNILLFSGLSITTEFVLSNYNAKRIFNNSLIHLCTTMVLGLVFLPKITSLVRGSQVHTEEIQNQDRKQHDSFRNNTFNSTSFAVSEIEQTVR